LADRRNLRGEAQLSKPSPKTIEHCRVDDNDAFGLTGSESLEGGLQVVGTMNVDRLQFDAKLTRNFGHLLWTFSTGRRRVVEHAKALGTWKQLLQYFDFLRVELGREDADARHVALRFRQAGSQAGVHEIIADTDDGNCFARGLCRAPGRFSVCENHARALAHERFSKSREPVEPAFGKAHVEPYVLAIDEPMPRQRFAQ
jgi:hypothetical protein